MNAAYAGGTADLRVETVAGLDGRGNRSGDLSYGIQQLVQPGRGEAAALAGNFADGAAGLVGFLRDGGGLFVADLGSENGAHCERLLDEAGGAFAVDFEAANAALLEI